MTTKKEIENNFNEVLKLMKKERTKWEFDKHTKRNKVKIGSWGLDNNSIYGGYEITEIVNEAGGETHPFGEGRKRPKQFNEELKTIIKSMHLKNKRY